jgi:hypothetical protein
MTENKTNHSLPITGGGEMGKLIREKDWSQTPVGDITTWPQSLKTTLSILLNSRFPMFLWWGPELVCFYNDAYRPSLGIDGKHPSILGMPAKQAWTEIWDIILPLINQVLTTGEATWSEDQLVPIFRNGKIEDVYWTFSYSPVEDESGVRAGVFVTCTETTDKVNNLKELTESNNQLSFTIEAAELGTFDFNPQTNKFSANYRLRNWFGLDDKPLLDFSEAMTSIPENDQKRINETLEHLADASSGGNLDMEFTVIHPISRQEVIVKAKGKMQYNEEKKASRFTGTLQDVTEHTQSRKKIEGSEKQFRSLIEQAPLGITIFRGEDFIVEVANEAYLQIIDRQADYFIGKPLFEVLPEVKDAVKPLLSNVLKTGIPYHGTEFPVMINRYGKKDLAYFNFVYHPLKEESGAISGVIVIASEVTSMVSARHSLEQSEKWFRNIVMQSPIAMTIFRGKDFIIEMANKRLIEDIWRRSEEEVMGKSLLEVFPELISQKYPELLNTVYDTGVVHTEAESVAYVQGNDGLKKFYLDFEYAPLYDVNNQVSGIMVTVNDVSEKVEARQKIEESEARFRLMADAMPQFVWSGDKNGNLTYFNQAVYNYSGFTPDEFVNGGWIDIVHPDEKEENIKAWQNAVATGNNFSFEHRFRRKDGTYRWQLSRAVPIKDVNGDIQLWVGTSTDIHEQKEFVNELEKQVLERTIELQQKNLDLEKMNKELQSFAYIASHDLQEPLRKIQTFAGRIIDKESQNLSDTGKDYFNRMRDSAQRMQLLIDDLLSYSRTNNAEKVFENINLNTIVEDVKLDLREEILQINAIVEVSMLGFMKVVPVQFRQLFYNLISNSLKFSRPNLPPHIMIEGETKLGKNLNASQLLPDTTYLYIRISDNGIGFDQQYGDRIFELFQRLHSKHEYTGTGIGLAIVKRIVENHNGLIIAEGHLNKGATFHIYFPAS